MTSRNIERQTVDLVDRYRSHQLDRRDFIRGLLALGLSTSVAGVILAACTPAAPASPGASGTASQALVTPETDVSGVVRLLQGPYTADEALHQDTIIAAFKTLYPNIDVTYEFFDWVTAQTQALQGAEQDAFDVFFATEYHVISLSQNPAFEDISERVNAPEYASEKAAHLFWDRLATFGPRLTAIPLSFNVVSGLFINLDMLDAAGADLSVVQSRDALRDHLLAVSTPAAPAILTGWDTWNFAQFILIQSGADYLTPDMSEVQVKTPESLESATWFAELFTKDKVAVPVGTYDYGTAQEAFAAGEVAMLTIDASNGAFLQTREVPFKWAWEPFPGHTTQITQSNIAAQMMSANSPNKEAAWEMMKFWTGPEQTAYWCDVSGIYPARNDALEHGYGTNVAEPLIESIEKFSTNTRGPQPFVEWPQCNDEVANPEYARALSGEITPEQALDNIVDGVRRIVFG